MCDDVMPERVPFLVMVMPVPHPLCIGMGWVGVAIQRTEAPTHDAPLKLNESTNDGGITEQCHIERQRRLMLPRQ